MGECGFHQVEHAEDVGLERADQLLLGQVEDALGGRLLSGVVHEHVEATPFGRDPLDHIAAERLVAYVALEHERAPSQFADALGHRLRVVVGRVVGDRHVGALFGERDGHGRADAAVATGDEGRLAVQLACCPVEVAFQLRLGIDVLARVVHGIARFRGLGFQCYEFRHRSAPFGSVASTAS